MPLSANCTTRALFACDIWSTPRTLPLCSFWIRNATPGATHGRPAPIVSGSDHFELILNPYTRWFRNACVTVARTRLPGAHHAQVGQRPLTLADLPKLPLPTKDGAEGGIELVVFDVGGCLYDDDAWAGMLNDDDPRSWRYYRDVS